MAIAANITLVTVTGQYVDYLGEPIAGQVIFRLPKTLRNELADQIVVPSAYVVTLDAFGAFTVQLPATDDPQFHESFLYTVEEAFTGGRSWQTTLPEATTSVHIVDISPPYTGGSFAELAGYSAYVAVERRVSEQEPKISYDPAGIFVDGDYEGLDVAGADYADVLASYATYGDLLAALLVAQASDVSPFATDMLSLASQAEGWADLAIENAEELYPHPFIFTGSLRVQR